MTRLQRVLVPLLLLLSLYAVAWLFVDELPFIGQAQPRQYLVLIPVLAIAALGGYCVFELVWGVVSMGNADGAFKELQKDIADAKRDLKAKGIHVD